jgi:predicted nuclease of predicted toxin-antitoxin system
LKLLFDENLSFRLARALDDLFPGSRHINCSTRAIEELLRARRDELEAFAMSAVTLLRLL